MCCHHCRGRRGRPAARDKPACTWQRTNLLRRPSIRADPCKGCRKCPWGDVLLPHQAVARLLLPGKLACTPTNQSTNQSINQSIKQSINQSINQSIHICHQRIAHGKCNQLSRLAHMLFCSFTAVIVVIWVCAECVSEHVLACKRWVYAQCSEGSQDRLSHAFVRKTAHKEDVCSHSKLAT